MELKVKVICEDLPSQQLLDNFDGQVVGREPIHIGIQHGDQVVAAVSAHTESIVFEPSFNVSPMPDGKTNFLGPYAKGTPTQRFFYLSWVAMNNEGRQTLVGRTKIPLSQLTWMQVAEAVSSGRGLTVAVSLTDKRGKPRFGTIKGGDLRWE